MRYSFYVTQLVGDRADLGTRDATQDRWAPDSLGQQDAILTWLLASGCSISSSNI